MKKSKYFLYRNLRTKTFSLKYKGKVIAHPEEITLEDVNFNVNKKGRERVLREKRKHVHATVSGVPIDSIKYKEKIEIYYNPYVVKSFINLKTKEPIYEAKYVLAKNNKIYVLQ